jgi:pyrroloquinoline quinone biosynthesis protein B
VAVSADGRAWFLLNVSPDVRQQILAFPELGPREGEQRGTAIAGCVLTDAELDHTAGLLLLREGGVGRVHSTITVRRWLNDYLPIEKILWFFTRQLWRTLRLEESTELLLPELSSSGLCIRAFEVDPHVPRFVPNEAVPPAGSVIGLVIEDGKTRGRLVYAPCVASVCGPLELAARAADCVLIDGTFWDDEEPIRCGIGSRTARAMGHLPVSGAAGSLAWLARLPARHRVYLHINNTNPMLNERGPEHRQVVECGVRVGADGDCFEV